MDKIFLVFFIAVMIGATAFWATNPVKVNEVHFYDSSVKVENRNIENRNAKAQAVELTAPKAVVKQTTAKVPVKKTVQPSPAKAKTEQKPKTDTKLTTKAVVKTTTKAPAKTAKKVQPAKTQPAKLQPAPKVLTEKEEIIAWNQWRANVVNEITKLLQSTKILNRSYANRIDFTFDVDTAQNISNIKITVTPSRTQSEAEPKFRQIISMLNKSSVLKFPKGSQRTKVTVKDSVHHDSNGQDSDASHYSDYETIKYNY